MNKYLILNKNRVVASFNYDNKSHLESDNYFTWIESRHEFTDMIRKNIADINITKLPIGYNDIITWISARQNFFAITNRNNIKQFFYTIGISSLEEFINKTHCTSIHDTYWIKRSNDKTTWEDISPYTNTHSDIVSAYYLENTIICEKLEKFISPIFETGGSAPCAIKQINNELYYVKAECKHIKKRITQDPFAEYYASVIAKYLNFNAVDYSISERIKHDGTSQIVTESKIFTNETYGTIPARYVGLENKDKAIEFCKNLSDKAYNTYLDMLFMDCIIANVDRHGENIVFITNNDTQEIVDIAPMFDYNCAFLSAYTEEISRLGLMKELIKFNKTVTQTYKLIKQYKDYTKELLSLKQLKLTETAGVQISEKKLQCFNDILQAQVRYLEQI